MAQAHAANASRQLMQRVLDIAARDVESKAAAPVGGAVDDASVVLLRDGLEASWRAESRQIAASQNLLSSALGAASTADAAQHARNSGEPA